MNNCTECTLGTLLSCSLFDIAFPLFLMIVIFGTGLFFIAWFIHEFKRGF